MMDANQKNTYQHAKLEKIYFIYEQITVNLEET